MLDRRVTKYFGIQGLGKINTVPAREALAKIAQTYTEKYSSQAELAAKELSATGDREYFPMLQRIAESKPPNQVGEAVRNAARLGDEQAVPWLTTMLGSSDPFARGNAFWGLADTGARKAVPIMIDLLASSDENGPRMAEIALVRLTHRSVAPDKFVSGTTSGTHDRWMQWWLSHPDAPVYGPGECGEIQPLE